MPISLPITKIVVHCSATRNGKSLRTNNQTAAERINDWHKQRGFKRDAALAQKFNPQLPNIGYHYIIDTDGAVDTGRAIGEVGAHVKGHNTHSIGICLVGGITANGKNHGEYTEQQWVSLYGLLQVLQKDHPNARIYGHRDLSPDLNGDGTITPNEWIKDCPCFDVWTWLDSGEVLNYDHLFKE